MKKILFLATALAVAVSSFTPAAFAAESNNKFGVEDNKTVDNVPLTLTSRYDYLASSYDYEAHTSAKPMVANVVNANNSVAFSSKASLDMTSVAAQWNAYIAAAKTAGVSDDTLKSVADNSLTGEFTITVKADSGISAVPEVTGDDNVNLLFEGAEPAYDEATNTWTLVESLKPNSYESLATYFANPEPLVFTVTSNTARGAENDPYEITAKLEGSVKIGLASGDITVNFISTEGSDYLQLKVPVITTKKPIVIPTAEPGATAAPAVTPVPDQDLVVIPIGSLVKDVETDIVTDEDGNNHYNEVIENGERNYYEVTVVKPDGAEAEYGSDYVASIELPSIGKKYLTESDYNAIISNQYQYIQDEEVRDYILEEFAADVETDEDGNITYSTTEGHVVALGAAVEITVINDTEITVNPVYKYEVKNEETGETEEQYKVVEGLGGNTAAAAAPTATPTATPTTAPSSNRGGGGGGGSTVRATATPAPTSAPTKAPVVQGDDTLNYSDHYAYIIGYDDGTVRPANNITRAEVATIFFRLFKDESRAKFWSKTNSFSDVNAEDWYNNAISTVAAAGIVNGYEDGTFRPNAPITRAEFATIASRFATDEYTFTGAFTDISGHWAEDAIKKAAAVGWVTGYDDGTFLPDSNITRAEAMTIINRVTYRLVDASGLRNDAVQWSDNDPSAWYYANVQEATNAHTYTRADIGEYETWTSLIENRDWSELETQAADLADAAASMSSNGTLHVTDDSATVKVDEAAEATAAPTEKATEAPAEDATEAPTEDATEAPTEAPADDAE